MQKLALAPLQEQSQSQSQSQSQPQSQSQSQQQLASQPQAPPQSQGKQETQQHTGTTLGQLVKDIEGALRLNGQNEIRGSRNLPVPSSKSEGGPSESAPLAAALSTSVRTLRKLAKLCADEGASNTINVPLSAKKRLSESRRLPSLHPQRSNTRPPQPPTLRPSIEPTSEDNFEGDMGGQREIDLSGGVGTLVEVDTAYLNFGTFYPGKIFKCNVGLKNLSSGRRTVRLSFDEAFRYTKDELLQLFLHKACKTFTSLFCQTSAIMNAEAIHKCWHLMLPPSKTFEKTLSLVLAPGASVQVGVVIKSPCLAKPSKFYSMLKVTLSDNDPLSTLLPSEGQELRVVSVAETITPKLECCRELTDIRTQTRVIPLVVKCDEPLQRLKIPFKNNGARDIELNLSVTQFPKGSKEHNKDLAIVYYCIPSQISLASKAMVFITIAVKHGFAKTDLSESVPAKVLARDRRLLIAKISESQMIYFYVLDCTFI